MSTALDRNALYYPYIHIRDENWLKATLLCFRQVRRMVPPDFHLNDADALQPYRKLGLTVRGELRPLLTEEPTDSYPVYEAQHRLVTALKQHEEILDQRFSLETTISDYPDNPNVFQMHARKMPELMQYLHDRKVPLAWEARMVHTGEPQNWFALHPELGEAIMSVIAINIAEDKGLDIVTNSGTVHHALATLDEEAVINSLLRSGAKSDPVPLAEKNAEMVDELAELVMTTSFDLDQLSPEHILELIAEGKDLTEFKKGLLPIVSEIPNIKDPKEREQRLKDAADKVIEGWEKYKAGLPYFATEALVKALDYKHPAVIAAVIAGATSGFMLAASVGLGVAALTFSGISIWRGYKEKVASPFQYLSQIHKAGARLAFKPLPEMSANAATTLEVFG